MESLKQSLQGGAPVAVPAREDGPARRPERAPRLPDDLTSPAAPRPIRLLLVSPFGLTRAALRALLEGGTALSVVGEASNCRQACASGHGADVIVVEADLASHLEGLAEVLAAAPRARALLLTGSPDAELSRCAVRAGAVGVLSKHESPETLVRAVEKVHAGEAWVDRATFAALLKEAAGVPAARDADAERIAQLTRREREVITLVAEGLRNRQIGERLFISETTVRHHLTAVFAKLGLADRLELILYALKHGLAMPPE
jgi:DNA-binding NarL/FixJ family response regulator